MIFLANILNSQILLHFRGSIQTNKKQMKIATGNKSHVPMLFLTNNCNLLPVIIYMYLLVLLNKHWSVIEEKIFKNGT